MSTLGFQRGKNCSLNWAYWNNRSAASTASSPVVTFRASSPGEFRVVNSCYITNTQTDTASRISVFLASDTSTNRREIPILWQHTLPIGTTFSLATKDSPIILFNESNNNTKAYPGYTQINSFQDWGWVPQELCIYHDGNGIFDVIFFYHSWN